MAQGWDFEYSNDQDIDHDRARSGDIVVGVPQAGAGAGAIDVRLSSGGRQHLTQADLAGLPPAGTSDRFGTSVAYLYADGDLCSDLAIGVPGADGDRGAVVIARGSTSGIAAAGAVRLTGSTPGEGFGSQVVAAGKDLFVSAPGRTVSGRPHAGAVDHYRVGDDGVPVLMESISENTSGVPGVAEQDDRFGEVLSTRGVGLVVGEPSEDAGSRVDAGAVTVLSFSTTTHLVTGARTLAQDTPGVPGIGESGDRFGAALSGGVWLVIVGVPGEDVGSAVDAGMVQTFAGNTLTQLTSDQSLTQNSPRVPGAVESGDRFGASVAIGGFTQCWDYEKEGIAAGSPGEDLGAVRDAGTVTLLPLHRHEGSYGTYQSSCRHSWYQGAGGLGGTAETGDQLGATLNFSTTPYISYEDEPQSSDLLIGVPGEDVGTLRDVGGVHRLGFGTTVTVDTFGDSAGRAAGARYGSVFGSSS
jgi:hypothetical protein